MCLRPSRDWHFLKGNRGCFAALSMKVPGYDSVRGSSKWRGTAGRNLHILMCESPGGPWGSPLVSALQIAAALNLVFAARDSGDCLGVGDVLIREDAVGQGVGIVPI
jgi:hypothetical protein